MSLLVVTGTGTGVGKTVVTAALAALAGARGARVAVVKPAQTGVGPGEPGDLAEISRLAGVRDLIEGARFPDPLSPEAAARLSGRPPVDLGRLLATVRDQAATHDLVLVEGAGGLLVRYDPAGHTLVDLARELTAPVLLVVRAGLGTLSDTALALQALRHAGLETSGVIIGCWPARADLAACSNLGDLAVLAGEPVAGALPDRAGLLDPAAFRRRARGWLDPRYGGTFDAAAFAARHGRPGVRPARPQASRRLSR